MRHQIALATLILFVLVSHSYAEDPISSANGDPRFRRFKTQDAVLQLHHTYVVPNDTAQAFLIQSPPTHPYNVASYYLPHSSAATSEIAEHRGADGNYFRAIAATSEAQRYAEQHQQQQQQPHDTSASVNAVYFKQPPALFGHQVLHVEPESDRVAASEPVPPTQNYEEYRKRRYTVPHTPANEDADATATVTAQHIENVQQLPDTHDAAELAELRTEAPTPPQETRSFHDIFMRYAGPQEVTFGHVESRPGLFEQHFESLNKGNRYKGEVIWADDTGGYGAHHWDLAQGKL